MLIFIWCDYKFKQCRNIWYHTNLREYGCFHFYSRCVTFFLTMTRSLRCTCTKPSIGKASKSYSSRGLSGISKTVRRILNQFYIFLARKYASFGHSGYFRNQYGRLSHLRAKYGKSPPKKLSIFTAWHHNFFTKRFDLVQISQHNGNYRMIPFNWYVLCIGTLLCWHAYDVMFMGCNSQFWTQKNYASATLRDLELCILPFLEGPVEELKRPVNQFLSHNCSCIRKRYIYLQIAALLST